MLYEFIIYKVILARSTHFLKWFRYMDTIKRHDPCVNLGAVFTLFYKNCLAYSENTSRSNVSLYNDNKNKNYNRGTWFSFTEY